MKRKFKKILSGALTLAMLTTTSLSTIPVNAAVQESYDIDNPSYNDYVNQLGTNFSFEEELVKAIKPEIAYDTLSGLKHIYHSNRTSTENSFIYCTFEQEGYILGDTSRYNRGFTKGYIDFSNLTDSNKEFWNNHTKEELNDFLAENGFTARFGEYLLKYDANATEEEVIKTYLKLNEKYGLKPYCHIYTIALPCFEDGENGQYDPQINLNKPTTTPTATVNAPTIAGDLDLNNEQGIADIVALTKYNTSAELFPITDATALANADVNQDGTIDAIDTSLLIEIMLGTFESAV